jgi:hypothetical protein
LCSQSSMSLLQTDILLYHFTAHWVVLFYILYTIR